MNTDKYLFHMNFFLFLRLWLIFHEFRSYLADFGRNVRWGIRQMISSSEGVNEYPAQGLLSYSRGNKFETGLGKFIKLTHALALIDDGNPAQAEAGVRELGELHGGTICLLHSQRRLRIIDRSTKRRR
jgi:hypothetical protein